MKKLIHEYKRYFARQSVVLLIAELCSAAIIAVLLILLGKDFPDITWLLIAALTISAAGAGFWFFTCFYLNPRRIEKVINTLPEGMRTALCEQFEEASPDFNRWFLRDFLVDLNSSGEIILYSTIRAISYDERGVTLKFDSGESYIPSRRNESAQALCERITEKWKKS